MHSFYTHLRFSDVFMEQMVEKCAVVHSNSKENYAASFEKWLDRISFAESLNGDSVNAKKFTKETKRNYRNFLFYRNLIFLIRTSCSIDRQLRNSDVNTIEAYIFTSRIKIEKDIL